MDMIRSIRDYVEDGGYVYGEAGGLMYLVDSIEGYSVCGIFSGKSTMTDRLQRFGYVNILLKEDCMLGQAGDKLTGQEFHRSVIETDEEQIFHITKPMSKRKWQCGFSYKNALGIYQHINFLGNEKALDYMLTKIEKDVR
jgi:cobyrinic acid a,c-diamide synthase